VLRVLDFPLFDDVRQAEVLGRAFSVSGVYTELWTERNVGI
jgi:hypothetical protein